MNTKGNVTGVWLRREGAEDDAYAVVVVQVEIDGVWRDIIRESLFANFSHCAHIDALEDPTPRDKSHEEWKQEQRELHNLLTDGRARRA